LDSSTILATSWWIYWFIYWQFSLMFDESRLNCKQQPWYWYKLIPHWEGEIYTLMCWKLDNNSYPLTTARESEWWLKWCCLNGYSDTKVSKWWLIIRFLYSKWLMPRCKVVIHAKHNDWRCLFEDLSCQGV